MAGQKQQLWPNYGQSKQSENRELAILPQEICLEIVERLKILTESNSAYHVYSSMHTTEGLLFGFVYCMEHLIFENYLRDLEQDSWLRF